jgi:hypothetical protein
MWLGTLSCCDARRLPARSHAALGAWGVSPVPHPSQNVRSMRRRRRAACAPTKPPRPAVRQRGRRCAQAPTKLTCLDCASQHGENIDSDTRRVGRGAGPRLAPPRRAAAIGAYIDAASAAARRWVPQHGFASTSPYCPPSAPRADRSWPACGSWAWSGRARRGRHSPWPRRGRGAPRHGPHARA